MTKHKKQTNNSLAIQAKSIVREFSSGSVTTKVLRGVSLEIAEGEFVSIMGKSGAGKSTLMYQLSALDRPTSGSITVAGTDILALSSAERTRFRLEQLGYVFQDYALLPELSAIENVALPLIMQGYTNQKALDEAGKALAELGLENRLHNYSSQLSGGEQQRVSIARAVAHNPKILFADEPTANLDTASAKVVLDSFTRLHREGLTIVMVTHELDYARTAERIITMKDGRMER
jgi:putative ABC transport system ATP-binding protein